MSWVAQPPEDQIVSAVTSESGRDRAAATGRHQDPHPGAAARTGPGRPLPEIENGFPGLAGAVRGSTWLCGIAPPPFRVADRPLRYHLVARHLGDASPNPPRLLEGLRWGYLLRPLHLRFRHLLQAIYVGTLFSGILPLSGGDVIRGVMVARRTRVHVMRVLSTEFVERISDAVAIIFVVWFTLRGLMLTFALRLGLAALEVGVGLAVLLGILLIVQNVSIRNRFDAWKPKSRPHVSSSPLESK